MNKSSELNMERDMAAETARQIDDIALIPGRPLLISDADEVLLQFCAGLERYLETQGLWLDLKSFALTGNIKRRDTNEPVAPAEMPALLEAFFASEAHRLEAVPGAAHALSQLTERAQIVILSNVPPAQRHTRAKSLADQGMPYPVIANKGLKGLAVKQLAERVGAPVFFLDDIPHNLASVAEAHADTTLIHFIADRRLAKLIPPSKHSDFHTSDWKLAREFIERRLDALCH